VFRVRGKGLLAAEIYQRFSFSDLSSLLRDFLGDEVTEAIITVPAYFDDITAASHQGCR
jgi:molecular chaperone DnaK (HSP70)